MSRELYKRLVSSANASGVNLFLIEAPRNHEPYPPDGWFALRSRTRRVFMQLENDGTRMPQPDEIQRRLRVGEFEEVAL